MSSLQRVATELAELTAEYNKQASVQHSWELHPVLDEPGVPEGVVFDAAEWGKILTAARKIIKQAERDGISIKGPSGTGNPELNSEFIALNGDGRLNQSAETFRLVRTLDAKMLLSRMGGSGWCKTKGYPYGKVVVSILVAAFRINDDAISVQAASGTLSDIYK